MSKQIITYPYPPIIQMENGEWYEMPDPVTMAKLIYDLRNRVVELEKVTNDMTKVTIPYQVDGVN